MMLSVGAFGCYNCSEKKEKKEELLKCWTQTNKWKKLIYPNVLAPQTWDITEVNMITSP